VRKALLAIGIALIAGRSAQAQEASHKRAPPPKTGGAQAARSDAEIEEAIRVKLQRSAIAGDHFEFHVQGGVATIEGRTAVVAHKGAATALAKAAGAIAVVNHIEVSEAAREKARANLESGRRREQVKRGDRRSGQKDSTKEPGQRIGSRTARIQSSASNRPGLSLFLE
jgi:hypothetical protein